MLDWYEATRNSSAIAVRDKQWLLVGPWVHGGNGAASVGTSTQGELSYPNAAGYSNTMAWNFLDYYLLDTPNNWESTDFITYYEIGKDQWATSNATRIEVLNEDVLYLNDNASLGNSMGTSETSIISDPKNPSPTIGGANLHATLQQGPFDQISLASRNDIITFETPVLGPEVSISGKVTLDLFVESDQPDCDITVRLVDVYPDGRNMLITDGIKRMRFRDGYTQGDEVFMTPGSIYEARVELAPTNYTWLAGHKIKAYIGSNSYYRWDVNLQNGGTMYAAGDTNIANIVIHHDATSPSRINLPGNNPSLSVEEANNASFTIYPNPSASVITVKGKQQIEDYVIRDLSGRILDQGKLMDNTINTDALNTGNYLLEIKSNGVSTSKRFIKF